MRHEFRIDPALIDVSFLDSVAILKPANNFIKKEQAQELKRLFKIFKKKRIKRLILDFTGCDFISSEGLGTIASFWHWYHDLGHGNMALVLPQEKDNELINLLEITGLAKNIGSALQKSLRGAVNYIRLFS